MCLRHLGYAVTAHRAQGVTVDTANMLVEPTTTRENFYVAMTRGKHSNHADVVLDRSADAHTEPHPGANPDAAARSVLYGVPAILIGRLSSSRCRTEPPRVRQRAASLSVSGASFWPEWATCTDPPWRSTR